MQAPDAAPSENCKVCPARHLAAWRQRALVDAELQVLVDLAAKWVQAEFLEGAGRAPEVHPFCLALGQSLFGPGADEVAFDFGHKSENDRDDLGLHGIVEYDSLFAI